MTFLSGFLLGMVGMITPRLVLCETIAGPRLLGIIAIMDLLVLVFGIMTTLDEDHPHLLSKGRDSPLLRTSEAVILPSQMFPIVPMVPPNLLYTNATREDLMTDILRIPNLGLVRLPGLGMIMIESLLGN